MSFILRILTVVGLLFFISCKDEGALVSDTGGSGYDNLMLEAMVMMAIILYMDALMRSPLIIPQMQHLMMVRAKALKELGK